MKKYIATLCLSATSILAQAPDQQATPAQPAAIQQDITVTTTVEPFPLSENNRSVAVLDTAAQPLLFNNPTDFLRLDTALNLQARGGNGVQTDLSIRGTTFEQSLVLLNGLRINDPETGHLNLDLPVPLEAISRIDVLHGSGSTFYGSDALGGAVNLITAQPSFTSIAAKIGFGNFGSEEQHLRATYNTQPFTEQLTGSRDTSDGFIPDRGYHSLAGASESWLNLKPNTPNYTTDILLAASDRPYGANQFYGPYPSWERTKGWFAAIQQQLGPQTAASFGYRRHTDLFVLFVGQPSIYENNHITTSYEGAVRRVDTLPRNITLSYGLEADGDSIHSTNLGQHARNQGAGYASLNLAALGRFSLSVGAREEVLSGNGSVFSPSVAAAYTATRSLRLRASVGHGFRIPTYLDLYYSDPTTIGNPNLQPESSWSYDGGFDWNPGGRFVLSATGFRLQEKDTIDYSKPILATPALTFAEPWQATNIPNFHLTGAEATFSISLTRTQRLQLGYAAAQAGPPPPNIQSEYAFNYAAQNALLSWSGILPTKQLSQISASAQLSVIQRTTQSPYALFNLSLVRNTGLLRPYMRLLNLTNTSYEEIPNVPLQGRTIMAGAEINWTAPHH